MARLFFAHSPRIFCLAALLCLFCAAPAPANPGMAGQSGKGAEASFARMDTKGDGKVTREAFFAAFPQMKEGAFAAIDANNDGIITREEWMNFSKGHASADSAAHPKGEASGDAAQPQNAPEGSAKGAPDMVMPAPKK